MGLLLVLLCYFTLTIIWGGVAFIIWNEYSNSDKPFAYAKSHRKLLQAGIFVSASLAFDSCYWLIDTASREITNPINIHNVLQNPYINFIEKIVLIISAVVFLKIILAFSKVSEKEIENNYFTKFVDGAFDAITVLNPDATVKYWNRAAELLFKWKFHEVEGKSIYKFMVPVELNEETKNILNRIKENRTSELIRKTTRLTAKGELIEVSINTLPILDNEFQGYTSIIRKTDSIDLRYNNPYFTPPSRINNKKNKIFVAMPYSPEVYSEHIWNDVLKPVIEKLNLIPVRADKQLGTEIIMNQVFDDIITSDIFIADLSTNNSNVIYETGLAHALGRPCIHLMDESSEIPFNLSRMLIIRYNKNNLAQFREKVEATIKEKLNISNNPL